MTLLTSPDGTETFDAPDSLVAHYTGLGAKPAGASEGDPHAGLRALLRTALVGGGAALGGGLGAGAGTVFGAGVGAIPGAVGGSALGAAGGEAADQLLERATGGAAPQTSGEAAKRIGIEGGLSGAITAGTMGVGLGLKSGAGFAYRQALKNPRLAKLAGEILLHTAHGPAAGALRALMALGEHVAPGAAEAASGVEGTAASGMTTREMLGMSKSGNLANQIRLQKARQFVQARRSQILTDELERAARSFPQGSPRP